MPWYFPWSESIKKRACRYLLQRYLGHFLKEKLTLEQLSVDLYNGKGTIKDLSLDVVSLNEALDSYNVPFEIVDGFIGSITVDIPWSALVNDNTSVEVSNLELTVQPKQREDRAGGMLESMFTSMTSSLELAQECLKQEPTEGEQHAETAQPFDGLEMFAMTIEAVLSRIKMTFADTVIRLEHLPKDAKTGAALELRVQRVEYFDDIAADPGTPVDQSRGSSAPAQALYETPAISHKNVHLMGVSLFCDEFADINRTQSKFGNTDSTSQHKVSVSVSPPLSPPLMNLNLDSSEVKDTSDPIKIADLMGKQEVKLKIKQNEEVHGPKMEVECVLGILNLHLSPRQVHLLLEIASGLTASDSSNNTNPRSRRSVNRPMDPEDEEKVEQELQKRLQASRLNRFGSAGLGPDLSEMDEPFATQSLEDSEDEMYFDLDNQSVSVSMTSSLSSTGTMRSTSTTSTRSSFNPSAYSRRETPFQSTIPRSGRSRPKSKHKESLHKLLDDTSSELAKYKLRVSFLSAMVLHEDPPTTPSDALDPGQTSTEKLRELSDKYFSRVKGINTSGYSTSLASLRGEFSKACPMDHISVLVKPLTFECSQRCSSSMTTSSVELTVGHAEVVEALFDRRGATASIMGFHLPIENILPDYCELLIFPEDELPKTQMFSSLNMGSGPSIKVKVQTWEKVHQSPRRHSYSSSPKAEVHLELGKCRCEVDVSLIDRIHALLNPQPLTKTVHSVYMSAYKSFQPSTQSQHALFNQTLDEGSNGSERPTDLRISSPLCTITVRFPIPDLRSSTGVDKPWWRRCLREEKVLLEFTDTEFQSSIHKGEPLYKIEFTCREGKAMFQEKPDQRPVPFIFVAKAESSTQEREEGFDWPRVELRLFPKLQSQLEEVAEEQEDSSNGLDSLNGACQFEAPRPSPFSGRKVLYDNDELVLPGDRQETARFQENCLSRTEMSLDLNLPHVNIYLQNKDFFELIYNRLLNDLVLWEPVAPAPLDVGEQYSFAKGPGWSVDTVTPFMQHNQGNETFSVCKSGIQNDSSSESDTDINEFYSTTEFRNKHKQKQNQDLGKKSKLCLNLVVGRGRFTALCPPKGEDGQPVPGHHGELCLDVVDGSFFTVVQTNGDPELQHMCVHVHRAALHHNGSVPDSPRTEGVVLGRAPTSIIPPEHLTPTMYLSDRGVETRLAGQVGVGHDTQDMLSVAVQVRIDMLTNVEECLVALGVKGTTLLHKMTPTNQSWFDQLVDFFDVKEYPVLGYNKPQIVTQLHAHLWSCSIDYRPLYLPYRTVLTLETFSISSNVVAESPTCKLRFRVEDGALYLSHHHKYRHSKEVDLRRDYVCVADVGVFELILTTSDGRDPKYPKLDLRVTNNILHIRTCSDSCQALAELINYMAEMGDLVRSRDGSSRRSSSMLTHSASSSTLSESPQLSQSHMEQVHDMMADAMRESSNSSLSTSKESSPDNDINDPREVFFFPGEGSTAKLPEPAPSVTVATSGQYSDSDEDSIERSLSRLSGSLVLGKQADDLQASAEDAGSLVSSRESFLDEPAQPTNADDEYCIIDDPGLGIASRDGEPKIRILTNNPIQIIDNHFQMPLGKTDQLKAPKHFPPPVYKYTLQEMSVVWYMYGGRDFPITKHVKSGSSKLTTGAKHRPKPVGKLMWQARGGEERDIDTLLELQLSKVRLQHEIFPENTEQASRQIVLIHEVEIRDRLVSSKINKFLYQYTSGAMPRQSHANMVLIKAVQLRPDPTLPSQECSLKVSLQPLRFNIDQDSLFFLRTFFSDLSKDVDDPDPDLPPVVGTPPKTTGLSSTPQKSSAPLPVMAVGQPDTEIEEGPQDLIKFDEMLEAALDEDEEDEDEELVSRETPIFFKSFMFSPDVPIRLDYHGKRVDMEQGTFAGLLVGLAHLNCSELRLKRLHHRHGLLGFNRLLVYALNEWLNDIKRNQLPSILGGVGPLHSLVQLVQGMRDLFWLPVEQYRKDGRIIRGIQRGAHSFATCTAMSALELTNRVVQTVQYFAEVAYDMVSPGPSVRKKKYRKKLRRLTHPADLREGVSNAYNVVTEGFKSTAETIYHTAVDEHEQKGVTGAVGGVLRQLPPTVLQPVILVTEATSNVLGGMRNQLLPDKKKEDEEKWKPEED